MQNLQNKNDTFVFQKLLCRVVKYGNLTFASGYSKTQLDKK